MQAKISCVLRKTTRVVSDKYERPSCCRTTPCDVVVSLADPTWCCDTTSDSRTSDGRIVARRLSQKYEPGLICKLLNVARRRTAVSFVKAFYPILQFAILLRYIPTYEYIRMYMYVVHGLKMNTWRPKKRSLLA